VPGHDEEESEAVEGPARGAKVKPFDPRVRRAGRRTRSTRATRPTPRQPRTNERASKQTERERGAKGGML
jgi:hypothetical protein